MYTDGGHAGGYMSGDTYVARFNKVMLYLAVENALAHDMYVIADWHILYDNNPLFGVNEAAVFFDELSKRYGNNPGVLYEICNEPNGATTWWDIVQYANVVIPVIRKNAPKSIIIVGTPNYSYDIYSAIASPLPFENVMYTFHFYTGLLQFKEPLEAAIKAGTPVFVTEWGVSRPPGGALDMAAAKDFIRYAKLRRISWAYWSLANSNEDYSVLRSDSNKLHGWSDGDLTEPGKLIFKSFRD
jgi:aryl-phospho-beta-D-glucosidase BglC (GH1 family)